MAWMSLLGQHGRMDFASSYDAAVVVGGIMRCSVALALPRGGMRVALFERDSLCREASGRNAGGHDHGRQGPPAVALRAQGSSPAGGPAPEWRRFDAGVRATGGMVLALTDEEAAKLEKDAAFRRAAGVALEVAGPNRVREIEPGLSGRVLLATYCRADDGYGNPNVTGLVYRPALAEAGVDVFEGTAVAGVAPSGTGFAARVSDSEARVRRIVLAGGAWLERMAPWLGVPLPVLCDSSSRSCSNTCRAWSGWCCGPPTRGFP